MLFSASFTDSLPSISTDSVKFDWSAGAKVDLKNVKPGDLDFGKLGDPTLRLALMASTTPAVIPEFTLTGSLVLEEKLSRLKDLKAATNPRLEVSLLHNASKIRVVTSVEYSTDRGRFRFDTDYGFTGTCGLAVDFIKSGPLRLPAPSPDSYDCMFDKVDAFTSVQPVPEPSTWAFLIVGFGAIGTQLRRRPKVVAARAQPVVPPRRRPT